MTTDKNQASAEGERNAGLIDNLLMSLDQIARDRDMYEYGLPIDCSATDGPMEEMRQKVRATVAALQPDVQPKGTYPDGLIVAALELASRIADRVPTRVHLNESADEAFRDIGRMVNAQDDGTHGYRLISDALEAAKDCDHALLAIMERAGEGSTVADVLDRLSAAQAPAPAHDLYVGLIERLMTLSTRLGIAYEGGVEHFGASLEDRLYAICRSTERLLDSLGTQAPAVAQQLIGYLSRHRADVAEALKFEPGRDPTYLWKFIWGAEDIEAMERCEHLEIVRVYRNSHVPAGAQTASMRQALEDLAKRGTHYDTCPTRRLCGGNELAQQVDSWWLRYFMDADAHVRKIARDAPGSSDVPVQHKEQP